jgi:phosphotransferase system enzyme I (PtsI)
MKEYQGIPAAPGVAFGPAFHYEDVSYTVSKESIEQVETEIERFDAACSTAKDELALIQQKAQAETGSEEAEIFQAHSMFLDDPALVEAVREQIRAEKVNAEWALEQVVESLSGQLDAMEDEYFRARAADVRDVGGRVMRRLLGMEESDLSSLSQASIVVARDLTPSDTVRLDKSLVLGFATAEGGPTSHTAILAKALALPAVVGAGAGLLEVGTGDQLAIDGSKGLVVSEPDRKTAAEFKALQNEFEAESLAALEHADEPALTRDGHQLEVVANVGNLDDARSALDSGAEGIGLLRTEFLYLDRSTAPNEEEQYQAYKDILDLMDDRPVVVRTLDVGGDKELPYLDLGSEANPFLGYRAIRMCLDRAEFFKVQLRALLRASPGHDLRIMFPMIATLDEVRRARALLDETRGDLEDEGLDVAAEIQIGIMVEIPAVAVLADQFAREVDFFSIGTNDLTQYTMAAERTNDRVAYLGDAAHPAVLRQIGKVIEAAHAQGIWVGLCGELAGDPQAIPVLLGLGLDEFSMAPASIPRAKVVLRNWSMADAQQLAGEVLELDSAEAVRERVLAQS